MADASTARDGPPATEQVVARDFDAVEVAMATPAAWVISEPPVTAAPAMPPSPAERLHLEGAARAKAARCLGKRRQIDERDAWALAEHLVKETLDGKLYVPAVGTSTHFHAVNLRPNWVGEMRKMVRYGIHKFYRPIAWGDGADEPVWGTAALAQAKMK